MCVLLGKIATEKIGKNPYVCTRIFSIKSPLDLEENCIQPRHFETERSVAEIKPEPNDPNKLRLTIDGVSVVNWFRQKHRELLQMMGIKANQESRRNKGVT